MSSDEAGGSGGPGAPGAAAGALVLDEPAPGVARLTISNPARRGALNHAMLSALVELIPTLDQRCLIITGEATTFSAGFDLVSAGEDLASTPDAVFADRAEALITHPFEAAIEAVQAFRFPTIAALNGHAIGGGLELAVSCDLRIAAAGIQFGMPPAKLGLIYAHTGLRRFIETVGAARTRELFLTARRIDAGTAHSWGLVNSVTSLKDLAGTALGLATDIAALAPLAQTGNKHAINAVLAGSGEMDPKLEEELVSRRRAGFTSEDFREGVTAFSAKRPPVWRGR